MRVLVVRLAYSKDKGNLLMTTSPVNSEMELMLRGYGMTTAQILYRLPDHPSILQTFLWQHYDVAPTFPELKGFLKFWQDTLDGPLHSVRFVHRKLISASEWRNVAGEIVVH